ncbi:MAG: hypothetical protein ACLQQ4_19655 [Bacteroidia bacterium]
MKLVAIILLSFFSFLTIQPLIAVAQSNQNADTCTMSCCHHQHKEKKAPTPMKGMCGEISCNPFGQYACCTGFIISAKTHFIPAPAKTLENIILFTQSYTSHFACDCWRPPENTVSI